MDVLRHCDPYVILFISDQDGDPGDIVYRTETVRASKAPVWNEEFMFAVTSDSMYVSIVLFDHDAITDDDLIGAIQIPMHSIEPWKQIDQWYAVLNYSTDKERMADCKLRLQISVQPADSEATMLDAPEVNLEIPPANALAAGNAAAGAREEEGIGRIMSGGWTG
ncbi:C2 domain-containing protein [Baffinella frigidus]|nr:C2 domain-containing protein [Cryptophyta sp. CCMP2293]